MDIVFRPIGHVRGGRAEATNDHWGPIKARIELDPDRFRPDALKGLKDFSHVEVVFFFHGVKDEDVVMGARHPRGRADWPSVGIFAQRGKSRPNRIGVSTCRVMSVHDLTIEVEGLDAIDGTPVLDVKPVLKAFLPRGVLREPPWAFEIMKTYW
jgi:tRNA-Thr(GGU) m(6)t(6)A37 methyltransferase TsaA